MTRVSGIALGHVLPFLVAAIVAGSAAQAALERVEDAYELGLGQVTLPVSENGTVMLRRCGGCPVESLRVTAGTRYLLRPGARALSLRELRQEAARLAARPRTSLFVYYDPRTRLVNRLVLDASQ